MIARRRCKSAGRRERIRKTMARQDTERLQREIDNLLRDLKRSGEDLAATRCKLQKLFDLSSSPHRGAKSRDHAESEARGT